MSKSGKIVIVVILALVVGAVLIAKQNQAKPSPEPKTMSDPVTKTDLPEAGPATPRDEKKALPRLVDLGAGKCIPCKMMAPILEELKKEYEGKMEVVFIDVWENREAGEQYGIRAIPTQIFYDASGKERFRHEGFFSKEDILAKCEELGFNLKRGKTDG